LLPIHEYDDRRQEEGPSSCPYWMTTTTRNELGAAVSVSVLDILDEVMQVVDQDEDLFLAPSSVSSNTSPAGCRSCRQ
jgi:hypothetical protein